MNWMKHLGIDGTGMALPKYAAALLMSQLGLTEYINSEECSIGKSPYLNIGWNKGNLIGL